MSKLIKNITAILMMLILMITTLQLSIYKMECLISGNIKISFSDFDNCKGNKKPTDSSISKVCCHFHQMKMDFDYDADFSNKAFTQLPQITIDTIVELPQLKKVTSIFNFFTNLPPPSGYDLLKIVQVFRL